MPNIDSMKTSKYLKKEDVGSGAIATISKVIQENMTSSGKPDELKWMIYFTEFIKPLVSNVTHREQIANIIGTRESDEWVGQKVVLWDNPDVEMGGRKVGGIRVRDLAPQAYNQQQQPQQQQQQPQQQQPQQQPQGNDPAIPQGYNSPDDPGY